MSNKSKHCSTKDLPGSADISGAILCSTDKFLLLCVLVLVLRRVLEFFKVFKNKRFRILTTTILR